MQPYETTEPPAQAVAQARAAGLELTATPEGLALTDGTMELRADFTRMLARLRPAALSGELLVRAARVRGVEAPVAVDATAGLGEDSLLLAAAGFRVRMFECNPVICALLADALARAASHPVLGAVVARMELTCGDSLEGLARIAQGGEAAPDVVYLDPMFPARQKSAAVKKKFQLLHHLESPCANEEDLLRAALAAHPRKVVIKRPAKGPQLAGARPSYSMAGKAVRYDCIVPPRP